jgi:hypothetical protein
MQRPFTILCALAIAAFVASTGCERHTWDETQKLHQPHGGHGDHGDHGDKHEGEKAGHHDSGEAKKEAAAPHETAKPAPEKGEARDTGVK